MYSPYTMGMMGGYGGNGGMMGGYGGGEPVVTNIQNRAAA